MKKVICIGSATKDIVIPLDEVRVIDNSQDLIAQKLMAFEYGAKIYAKEIFEMVGGSAVNVAAGLTKSGYRTFVMARTSRTEIGQWILKRIGKLGIKKNYLQQGGKGESEVAMIVLDKRTIEHFILRTGDSVEQFNLDKALAKYQEKVDWIYVGSQKKGWQDKFQHVFQFAQQKKAQIALNPSGFQINHDAKKLISVLSKIDVLFVNRDEAIEIVQNVEGQVKDLPQFLLEKLLSYGCPVVCLSDGERGAHVGNKDNIYHLGTQAVKKVDSVGAGDAFCSGFLASYMEEADLKKALAWGIANSASVVGTVGGSNGLLSQKELLKAGQKYFNLIKTINR